MVVVDGVRYRPEDAPKTKDDQAKTDDAQHKMRQPAKKATSRK